MRSAAGSTEARNVHADSCFGDFHLSAQIQDRDIRRCAPQLTFDGTLIVDMSKETPRPEKSSAMGLAATCAGKPTFMRLGPQAPVTFTPAVRACSASPSRLCYNRAV
jgi:hypothetical protein